MAELDAEEALALGQEILDSFAELPERAWANGGEYLEDVQESVKGVMETIERTERVSEKQFSALQGWRAGVNKWLGE